MAKTGFIFLLLLVASLFELATATNTCTWGFYMCASNSQCIQSRNRCDGIIQCNYREDETNCPTRCSGYSRYFRCSNNNCISRSYLCNGVNNCADGSDESTALCGGTAFQVRLVGGRSSNEGRVEVYYTPTRTWGTVCDDNWDLNDAKVVCRQLGLPRATQAVIGARFGQGTGPILLDEVQCTGSELTLSRCSSGGWKNHDCGHSEDAGVICGASLPLPTRRPTVNTGLTTCSWGNFYCSYGSRCVSSQWRCDGKSDCSNGEDERGCRTFCPDRTGNFRCNNYKCITRSFVCDGDNDCGDYSDESNYLCGSRRNTGALQCYSCSGSSGRCSSSITCSYLFGRGVCYKKTYDTGYGNSKRRVTDAGCRSSCTSSYRASACRNQRNCQMTCCSTSFCNRASSGGTSSPNPSCYTCVSTSSYQGCENKATLTRCSSTTSSCYKMDYKISSSYGNLSFYSKGCIPGSSSCSQMRSTYCNSRAMDTCNVHCCTGSGCNAGSVERFSVVVLMTCAIAFFISQNVRFLT